MCRGGYVKPWYPIVLCDHVVFLLPVHPVAPANLTAVAHAWNATLLWDWEYAAYAPLALACQVEITLDGHVKKVTARARVCVCALSTRRTVFSTGSSDPVPSASRLVSSRSSYLGSSIVYKSKHKLLKLVLTYIWVGLSSTTAKHYSTCIHSLVCMVSDEMDLLRVTSGPFLVRV